METVMKKQQATVRKRKYHHNKWNLVRHFSKQRLKSAFLSCAKRFLSLCNLLLISFSVALIST